MIVATRQIGDLPELDLAQFDADPVPVLDELRQYGRLARSTRGVEVLGYDLNWDLIRDQRLRPMTSEDFASHGATEKIAEFVDKGIFLFMPPDRHRNVRKIFARGFAVRRVTEHQSIMNMVAMRLLGELVEAGTADLTTDFCQKYSSEVLCRLLGFPTEDIPEFAEAALDLRHLVYVPMEPHIERLEAALDLLREYCSRLLAERRRAPQDDFLSALIAAEETEGRLTTDEVIWGTVNLLLGGIDTTSFQLSSALKMFIDNEVWDRLVSEPELIKQGIEESMRLSPVATMLGRIAGEDLEIDDVFIAAGTGIKLNVVAAGRDPKAFPEPHRFSLDRTPPGFPLGFGGGVHHCIGEALAMGEMVVATQLLTSSLENVQISGPVEMHAWTDAFYGPIHLPVRFDSRS